MVEDKTQIIVDRIKELASKTEKIDLTKKTSDHKEILKKVMILLESVVKFLEKKE